MFFFYEPGRGTTMYLLLQPVRPRRIAHFSCLIIGALLPEAILIDASGNTKPANKLLVLLINVFKGRIAVGFLYDDCAGRSDCV